MSGGNSTAKVVNSPVFRAGDWSIVSGITARIGEDLIPGGFEPQFDFILKRFGALLDHHGFEITDVAKITIYLADMANRVRMNDMYTRFFGNHLPARTVVGVREIARSAAVEFEGWIFKPVA